MPTINDLRGQGPVSGSVCCFVVPGLEMGGHGGILFWLVWAGVAKLSFFFVGQERYSIIIGGGGGSSGSSLHEGDEVTT